MFAQYTASEIVKKGEALMRGNNSYSKVEIIVEKSRFKRNILLHPEFAENLSNEADWLIGANFYIYNTQNRSNAEFEGLNTLL